MPQLRPSAKRAGRHNGLAAGAVKLDQRAMTDSVLLPAPQARPLVRSLPGSLVREIANAHLTQPDLIPLWFGESDLPTAPEIRAAAADSLAAGETFYSANLGLDALREGIAGYQAAQFGGGARAANVAVANSGLNTLLLAMTALAGPGDEVVTLTPSWPNIPAIPRLLGATVREVPLRLANGRFTLDLGELFAALNDRTRVVLVNSPHNPTGWMLGADDLAVLVDELDRRGIWLLTDEVYGRLVHHGAMASALPHFDDSRRLVVVNSFSKTWAMTGWRLGWMTAPAGLIPEIEKLIEFNASCAPVFVQRAGIAAIEQGEPFVAMQQERLMAARAVVQRMLGQHPAIALPALDAAFYAFPRLTIDDDVAFVRRLIAEQGVGLAPGSGFGESGRGHVRLCYAKPVAVVEAACARILAMLDG